MFLGLNWIKMMKARDVIQKLLPLCICSKPYVGLFVCGVFKCLKWLLHMGAVVIGEHFSVNLKEDVFIPYGILHGLFYGLVLCTRWKVYQKRSENR